MVIATTADIILLSACSFVGNVGKAVTGFGMAIIFLFVWQIVELAGYEGEFKYAVFIQSLALLSVQPLAMYNASVVQNSYRYMLLLFVPITLVSTPLGQLVADKVPTKTVQSVAGVLVTLVAIWEIYSKRNWFMSPCKKKKKKKEDKGEDEKKEEGVQVAGGDDEKAKGGDEIVETGEDTVDATTTNHTSVSFRIDVEGGGDNEKAKGGDGMIETGEDAIDAIRNHTKVNENDDFQDNNAVNDAADEAVADESDAPTSQEKEEDVGNGGSRNRDTFLGLGAGAMSTYFASDSNKNDRDEFKIGANVATFSTLIAGGASGFLGGMVAIRGPPLIFYFLHPPHPISFNKTSQRATATVITFFNVCMRQIFYLVDTFVSSSSASEGGKHLYQKEDWKMYLSVIICSIAGAMVGNKLFELLKDSKDTIRGILSVFLLMCGVSLLFSAFLRG